MRTKLKRWWWWLMHRLHPRHRYHLLGTGLPPGYYDPCIQIRNAVFESVLKYYQTTKGLIATENSTQNHAFDVIEQASVWWVMHRDRIDDDRFLEETRDHLIKIMIVLDHLWYP